MKIGPEIEDPPNSIARFQGVDIRELTVAPASDGAFDIILKTYFLERWRKFVLRGVRELPDLDLLFSASRIVLLDETGSGREFGSVKVEVFSEAFSELYADECESD
jgi:hypothetical protein